MEAIKTFSTIENVVEWCNDKGLNMMHTHIVPIVENGNTTVFKLIVNKCFVDQENE